MTKAETGDDREGTPERHGTRQVSKRGWPWVAKSACGFVDGTAGVLIDKYTDREAQESSEDAREEFEECAADLAKERFGKVEVPTWLAFAFAAGALVASKWIGAPKKAKPAEEHPAKPESPAALPAPVVATQDQVPANAATDPETEATSSQIKQPADTEESGNALSAELGI